MKGSEAPNRESELLAALTKAGKEACDDSEVGSKAEYMRSPMKVSHTSRMISMATYGGGCVQWLGGSRKGKGGEIINSARITPARNGGCRNKT